MPGSGSGSRSRSRTEEVWTSSVCCAEVANLTLENVDLDDQTHTVTGNRRREVDDHLGLIHQLADRRMIEDRSRKIGVRCGIRLGAFDRSAKAS